MLAVLGMETPKMLAAKKRGRKASGKVTVVYYHRVPEEMVGKLEAVRKGPSVSLGAVRGMSEMEELRASNKALLEALDVVTRERDALLKRTSEGPLQTLVPLKAMGPTLGVGPGPVRAELSLPPSEYDQTVG